MAQTRCFAKIVRIFARILILLILLVLLVLLILLILRMVVRSYGRHMCRTVVRTVVWSWTVVRSYGRTVVRSYGRMVARLHSQNSLTGLGRIEQNNSRVTQGIIFPGFRSLCLHVPTMFAYIPGDLPVLILIANRA